MRSSRETLIRSSLRACAVCTVASIVASGEGMMLSVTVGNCGEPCWVSLFIIVPACRRGVFSPVSFLFLTSADTGFSESGHLAVGAQGCFDDIHGKHRAGALTQAHLQVQEWCESQFQADQLMPRLD